MLTAKGSRQAEAVLEAVIESLGEYGYAGTSLTRVAEIAGVQKRMVLYYFGSRERLVAAALERVAGRFLDRLEHLIDLYEQPVELLDALIDAATEQLDDRSLIAAYFGLVAESASDAALRETLVAIRERAEELGLRAAERLQTGGHRLSLQPELFVLWARVLANGVGLELLQDGRTEPLDRAITLARAAAPLVLFE